MTNYRETFYDYSHVRSRKALQLCLEGRLEFAQGELHSIRTALKRLSGDLPIVGHVGAIEGAGDSHFATQTFAEARAWGWLEMASGVLQLTRERPGSGMMHFTRAWRIWRPWGQGVDSEEKYEAIRERVRARLWLGEAWARSLSDRAGRLANAILHAALTELTRIEAQDMLQETIAQQSLLPPAPRGSPAYREDGCNIPYLVQIGKLYA